MIGKIRVDTESPTWVARREEKRRAIKFLHWMREANQTTNRELLDELPSINIFSKIQGLDDLTYVTKLLMQYAYFNGRRDKLRDLYKEKRIVIEKQDKQEEKQSDFAELKSKIENGGIGIDDVLKMFENMYKDERGLFYYSYVGMIHPEYTHEDRFEKATRLQDICEELDIAPADFARTKDLERLQKAFQGLPKPTRRRAKK